MGTEPANERALRRWYWVPRVAGAMTVLVAVLTLAGWYLREPDLIRFGLPLAPMWPSTSLVFLLLGGAVLLRSTQRGRRAAAGLAGAVAVSGAMLFIERLTDQNLLPEEALLPPGMPVPGPWPGLTSGTAALNFVLSGLALLLLHRPSPRRAGLAGAVAALLALSSVIALAGWAFGLDYLAGLPGFGDRPGLSLQAAVLFIVMSFAIPSVAPELGGMAILSSPRLGGYFARRLVLAAAIAPAVGMLVVTAARRGYFEFATATAWMTVITLALALTLVLVVAARLNALDEERMRLLAQTEDGRRWLEAVVKTSPAAVMLFRPDGTIEFNEVAERLFGRKLDPKSGSAQYTGQVLRPDGRPVPREELPSSRVLQRGEVVEGEEFLIRTADGTTRSIMGWAAPIRDDAGATVGGAGLFFDISERKGLEQQLRAAVGARDQLLRVVSHDLRNPMNAVSLNLSSILLAAPPELGTVRRAAERGQRAVKQLQRLVEDLLDVQRLARGQLKVEPRPVAVADVLGEVRELFADAAREAGVSLELESTPGLAVRADSARLLQVFSNLVGNALKFTARDGRVRVRAGAAAEGGWVRFTVQDTGQGMTPEEAAHVFEPFWQAADADRRGLGIGVPIAQAIVTAHGGTLEVTSTRGVGTTFSFALPEAPLHDAQAADTAGPAH